MQHEARTGFQVGVARGIPAKPTRSHRRRRATTDKNGFTLTELSIVLMLILIVSMLCLPALVHYASQQVAAETAMLKTACWYTQYYARTQNGQKSLIFNVAGNSYTFADTKHALHSLVKFGSLPNVFGPPASPHKQITAPVTFVGQRVTFSPLGIIQPGSVYLIDHNQTVMYGLTAAVAGVSHLRMYHYNHGRWQPCA